jgi:hypothetical protein
MLWQIWVLLRWFCHAVDWPMCRRQLFADGTRWSLRHNSQPHRFLRYGADTKLKNSPQQIHGITSASIEHVNFCELYFSFSTSFRMVDFRQACHAHPQRAVFSHMPWQSPTTMDAAISLFESPLPDTRSVSVKPAFASLNEISPQISRSTQWRGRRLRTGCKWKRSRCLLFDGNV